MNKSIPIFNRLVVERDLKKKYNLHKQKIQDIQLSSKMFQQLGKTQRAQVNRKALMMEESKEKRLEIEKANILLLSKLSKIMNKTFRVQSPFNISERISQNSSQGFRQSKSLNREYRIKKLTQISEENQALLNRLVQQKGKYGEEKDHVKKYEYFMTNFNRFKPIGWEDERRSRSHQLSQTTQKPLNNNSSGFADSLSPLQFKEEPKHTLPQQSDNSIKQPNCQQTIQRRHFVGNKFYIIEITKSIMPPETKAIFEIKATEELSKKVYRLLLNATNANRIFSLYQYNMDTLISRIRFFKNTMVICPPEVDANVILKPYQKIVNNDEDSEPQLDISFQGIAVNTQRDLFKIYRQKKERNYIELLKIKQKKFPTSSDEKRKNLFSREMYRNTRFVPKEHDSQSHQTPPNQYMKVSDVLHETEKTNNQHQSNEFSPKSPKQPYQDNEQEFIDNMIENQIKSNESIEIQEEVIDNPTSSDANENVYVDNFEEDQEEDCQQL